ncbi:MAG: TolC family protein [Candidatus Thiodiazotropha sp. L084R]
MTSLINIISMGRPLLLIFFFIPLDVAALEPLPTPLSLGYALNLADEGHPERDLADAALALSEAERLQADAGDDLRIDVSAELRAIEPSEIAVYQTHNDSLARLRVSKQLYDFGRTSHALEAAEADLESRRWQLIEVRQQRRLDVMARFFNVLLADLENARDNEALSIDYIRFDRARTRNELGKVSDIEMLELESLFQKSRRKLTVSGNRQRITRSQLAISLNRPLDLPAELEIPHFEPMDKVAEVEALVALAITGNPGLRKIRAELQAAQKKLQASESEANPVIRAQLEAATYERELGGRNPLTASLVFELPLYQGSRVDAATAKQRALIQQKQAELAAYELALRQQVLDYWMELEQLRIESEEIGVTGDYRDLYLDRSRTLYDLDLSSDLGDSMTQIAAIQYQSAKNTYQIQLALAHLKALTGGLLDQEERAEVP